MWIDCVKDVMFKIGVSFEMTADARKWKKRNRKIISFMPALCPNRVRFYMKT